MNYNANPLAQDASLSLDRNMEKIRSRLAPLLARDEIAEIVPSSLQGIFLRRNQNVLELYCFDPDTRSLSDIMSRIDLTDPLFLHATYLRAQLLASCWNAIGPEKVYIAGFGGGRLGMLLHHCFEQIHIDGSEFDAAILALCESHFGLHLDDRFDVRVKDAALDLLEREGVYDIIVLDTFTSDGLHPDHLGDAPFIRNCYDKLSDGGVLVTNLVEMDPHLELKIAAIRQIFKHCLIWEDYRSRVVFGSQTAIDTKVLEARANALTKTRGLQFPFGEYCSRLKVL